ncbi:MAG: hypothetical protein ACRC3B_07365, partial [Bacteroidia bacterium]
MKLSKIIAAAALIPVVFELSGQSILHDYYNDNKDSMLSEAQLLISMPDPVFNPCQSSAVSKKKMMEMGYDQPYKSESHYFNARDGKKLVANKFSGQS